MMGGKLQHALVALFGFAAITAGASSADAQQWPNKPMPISESEAMRILHQVQEGVERPKASVSFEIGENVRVADGPFASFSGVVEEIDEARSRVKVAVSIFGRATPVELEFGQVEKV